MTQNFNTQDPAAARYAERMRELAERDPQIQSLLPVKAIQEASLREGLSNAEIIAIVLEGYADRPALAERRYEIALDPTTGTLGRRFLPAFDAITYRQLRERVEALASAWRHDEHHRVGVDDFVCILGFTGIDFTVVDMATAYAQAVTVPLQTTLGATHLETILRDTAPATLVATISDLAVATELAIKNGAIRSVVAIDYDPRIETERAIFEAAREQIKRAGTAIHLTTLADLIEVGRTRRWTPLPAHPQGSERLAALIHSSGSTGTPKGVMIPERAANFGWLGFGAPQVPTVGMAFGPMNHFIGRHQVYNALAAGGTVYYTATSDLSTLFEDIRLARPTFLSFFPRIFE
ncbi:MAG: AMP-binding protein, partial [Steroidobacteraceae bacterium]